MSKTPTQNDWKKHLNSKFYQEFKGLPTLTGALRPKMIGFISKLLSDARKEVIDSIHDKFCEFAIQGGDDEQAQKGIMLYARTLQYLSTLRKGEV